MFSRSKVSASYADSIDKNLSNKYILITKQRKVKKYRRRNTIKIVDTTKIKYLECLYFNINIFIYNERNNKIVIRKVFLLTSIISRLTRKISNKLTLVFYKD